MPPNHWRVFFGLCSKTLGAGSKFAWASHTWCAWTTFSRLQEDVHYWSSGLPNPDDVGEIGINDGGVWGQPFLYSDLAHLIVPARFTWERGTGAAFTTGTKTQAIDRLAMELEAQGIRFRRTDLVLELKLY